MANAQDLLQKVNFIKSQDPNKVILDETKGSWTGAAIGMGVALFIAYGRKYNLLASAFIGATVGGLATKILIKK